MQRIRVKERANLDNLAKEHKLEFVPGRGITGWNESSYYSFNLEQIEKHIEAPAQELEDMCLQVVDRAVKTESVLNRLGIPEHFWDYLANSWKDGEKNLLGRMDFSYNSDQPIKLLEYNADTPTTLYESAVFQWEWLEQAKEQKLIDANCDQLNDIHDSIISSFSKLDISTLTHFTCNKDIEDDKGTLDYIEECANEAGIETKFVAISDIGLDDQGLLTDLDDKIITRLFKMYPWEWIMDEQFGANVPSCGATFFEPPWKAILSNKGLMALMWGMFEGHPNLLPAFFEDDPECQKFIDGGDYVRKPLLSRQGANIQIMQGGQIISQTDGPYKDQPNIIQGLKRLPEFDGAYPLIGCWLVASRVQGLCIREDDSLITGTNAQVVPHVILD